MLMCLVFVQLVVVVVVVVVVVGDCPICLKLALMMVSSHWIWVVIAG